MYRIYWPQAKPRDWEFMARSKETLERHPDTWGAYPDTAEGAMRIIDMEYGELRKAPDGAKSQELVHLATACLLLWRRLNGAE